MGAAKPTESTSVPGPSKKQKVAKAKAADPEAQARNRVRKNEWQRRNRAEKREAKEAARQPSGEDEIDEDELCAELARQLAE